MVSTLFFFVENRYHGPAEEEFVSIPSTMYWCCIFLTGEWAMVDFSEGAGSRICIFCCLVGVTVFAIPVGIIVEAVQSTMVLVAHENCELQDLPSETTKEGKGLRRSARSMKRSSTASLRQSTRRLSSMQLA
eukprot:gnl/TRDRNA2_/TRDRNA2_157707_c0_seq1.p1 gnl/TRDRNA2_/TRDRNA2_157707_c0~~gnl/TRDRNA2_/TRDRNA2_157707_c0_seq1.p1  ORF type:complete len:153 (+),score=28.87 gnl/TRDRNA2_/TRDRNA2_157707_c0_seq1:64-459(+)